MFGALELRDSVTGFFEGAMQNVTNSTVARRHLARGQNDDAAGVSAPRAAKGGSRDQISEVHRDAEKCVNWRDYEALARANL